MPCRRSSAVAPISSSASTTTARRRRRQNRPSNPACELPPAAKPSQASDSRNSLKVTAEKKPARSRRPYLCPLSTTAAVRTGTFPPQYPALLASSSSRGEVLDQILAGSSREHSPHQGVVRVGVRVQVDPSGTSPMLRSILPPANTPDSALQRRDDGSSPTAGPAIHSSPAMAGAFVFMRPGPAASH